jgi:hypothetical protein
MFCKTCGNLLPDGAGVTMPLLLLGGDYDAAPEHQCVRVLESSASAHLLIKAGSHKASCGTNNSTIRNMNTTIKNGIAPLRRSIIFILNVFLIKNKLTPMGGVISPISKVTTYNTPNHTKSTPREVNNGAKIGIVNTVMLIESRKHPRMRYKITMATTTMNGDKLIDVTKLPRKFPTPALASR